MTKDNVVCADCGETFEIDEVSYSFAKKFGVRILCHKCEGTTNWSLFEKELQQILIPMRDKLISKQPAKGNTWKEMPISELRNRMMLKYAVFIENADKEHEAESLVDICNYAMLLFVRLKDGV